MSLKHVVKERRYRERSQPAARAHRGLLEKKKDYVLRARDFHKKEDALRLLQEKALFRNPDEFYTGMVHSRVEGGVHRHRAAPADELELTSFKKGEEGYLAMKSATEAKRADRLRATLHGVDAPRTNKRTVFVDDAAHAARVDADLGPQAAAAEMAERKAAGSAKKHARRMREIAKQRRELEQRSERAAKLGERLQQLGVERALQGKGRRRRRASDEGTQRHYKWSQERKR